MFRFLSRAMLVCATCFVCACAQQADANASPDPSTIHVYVNLVQIPVLLLDSYRHPTKPVDAERFEVHLEGVATFKPERVRLQGDDPISLAILVDRSDPEEFLLDHLFTVAPELVKSLQPQDRVEVYGMDGCKLRRFSLPDIPDAARLQNTLAASVAAKAWDKKTQGPCAAPVSLWQSMLYIGSVLEQRGGRRILLALSNGQPSGSTEEMDRLRMLLNSSSTSLFAVRHGEVGMSQMLLQLDGGRPIHSGNEAQGRRGSDDATLTWGGYPLQIESELSGGMVMGTSVHSLPHTLTDVIARVRGRYIVEFPRPAELTAGSHMVTVSIGKTRDFIRPAGLSLPVEKAATAKQEITPPQGHSNETEPSSAAVAQPVQTPSPSASQEVKENPVSPAVTSPVASSQADRPASRRPEKDPLDITDELQPVRQK